MYWSDLGLGGDPFCKVEVVGWYVVGWASLVSVRGWGCVCGIYGLSYPAQCEKTSFYIAGPLNIEK